MPHTATAQTRAAPAGLIDEVMNLLARGESALFADLAQAAWQPHTTLAALTNSLPGCGDVREQRSAG